MRGRTETGSAADPAPAMQARSRAALDLGELFFLAVSTGGHSSYVGILVSQICLQPRLEEITTLKNGDGADETDT